MKSSIAIFFVASVGMAFAFQPSPTASIVRPTAILQQQHHQHLQQRHHSGSSQHNSLVARPITARNHISSSSRLHALLDDENLGSPENSSNNDSSFMASLQARMNELNEQTMPLVVLDAMLPRQVFKLKVNNPLFMELVRTRWEQETPTFGMTGMARLSDGKQVHLRTGVVVEMIEPPVLDNEQESSITGSAEQQLNIVLRGTKRFRINGDVVTASEGWTEAKVQLFSDNDDGEDATTDDDDESDKTLAIAQQKAQQLTSPNMNMPEQQSLIDRWIQLARTKERHEGQIDQLLLDLGETPSPTSSPSDCAFWIGALINPLPAMGVALEVRPKLLLASTAEARVDIALDGILKSIKHMDGSAPLW